MTEETTTVTNEQVSQSLAETIFGGDDTSTAPKSDNSEQNQQQAAATETAATQETQTTTETTTTTTEEQEEILEPTEWLKRELGVESLDTIKQERDEYKKLKEKPQEYSFVNEDSKKLAEAIAKGDRKAVLKILDQQDKLEQYASVEVNKDTAADIIKMGMSIKYKDLSQSEIEYKFNKEFGLPKEPVQRADELEEEFAERKAEWQEKVNDILTNRVIEAKLLKPELERAKSELILPEIQREQLTQAEPTKEELEAWEKQKSSFIQSAESVINGFNGFTVQVKDKDVDYTVGYTPSIEEKTLINGKIKSFAETGFDANSIFAERWLEQDGKTLKVEQMVKDLLKLYADDKITSKMVNESGNKRLEAYLKEKKQVNVTASPNPNSFDPTNNQSELDKVREMVFS